MFTHSIPTIPWTKCLGLSGETTMTTKSSALTTVSTLLKRAKGTLGTLSGALSSALSSKWGPIIAASAIGAITLHEWQQNPLFRSRITSTYDGTANWLRAKELCHLHGGEQMFFTLPENYVKNGIICGFKDRRGVVSLLNEYDAMGQLVLHRIAPFTKGTTP